MTEKAQEWQEKAQNVTERAQEKAQDWQERAQVLTDRAKQWSRRAQDAARQAGLAADKYVHENTWTTVAVLAVAAVTLGFMLGRMRD